MGSEHSLLSRDYDSIRLVGTVLGGAVTMFTYDAIMYNGTGIEILEIRGHVLILSF